MTDCVDCGKCNWAVCDADGDYLLRDVTIKRDGHHVTVGDVELCGGHKRRAERLGRLTLDWDRIYRALEAQA